ncbi:flagellar motor protein MotD [Marinobacter sp.]|uniref:flagellar motor protein MotD n=1 Tax=Marinobacter sp. TaxID=50741 RepID=UPI0019B60668|nr:flagellar motor protein MotD [Marinobacter sp.]MBC7191880.1 flagellar motor protein MotD [Marinobacter sp.]MDY6797392.1 flagellar motor protein MotD [Pseudomonadota bacterium]
MRRRRNRSPDDLHNKERWLISYADFITLLFAFFVVMYSVSSVNEGKYKVLSDTLTGVFNAPQRSLQPIDLGEYPGNTRPGEAESVIPPAVSEPPSQNRPRDAERDQALQSMANQLSMEFEELINQGVITVERNSEWLALSLRNSLLFGSGEAEPHYDAFPLIERIAKVVAGRDNAIRVEGFTDNRPISTSDFPSNWELSAARAAAVVRLLAMNGIEPARMAAVGYGEYQPVARNDTTEGRSRNRRVVLMISRGASIRGALR